MTFKNLGLEPNKAALVESSDGTQMVAFHDNETWFEGHPSPERARVQVQEDPVKVVTPPK